MNLSDILNIEGEATSELEYCLSLQRAINSGVAWSSQGSMGRAMMGAIENGDCMLGKAPAHDYWGNRIPARDEVQSGTKGSYDFVAGHRDVEWADQMAAA